MNKRKIDEIIVYESDLSAADLKSIMDASDSDESKAVFIFKAVGRSIQCSIESQEEPIRLSTRNDKASKAISEIFKHITDQPRKYQQAIQNWLNDDSSSAKKSLFFECIVKDGIGTLCRLDPKNKYHRALITSCLSRVCSNFNDTNKGPRDNSLQTTSSGSWASRVSQGDTAYDTNR